MLQPTDYLLVVDFYTPSSEEEDDYGAFISVDAEEFGTRMSAKEYYDKVTITTKYQLEDFAELDSGQIELDGKPAYWLMFEHYAEGEYITVLGYAMTNNNTGYLISCGTLSEDFDYYLDIFQRTVESFRYEINY